MCQAECKQILSKGLEVNKWYSLDKLRTTSESSLNKRQKRKAITFEINRKLLSLDSPLHNQYVRSLNCAKYVKVRDDGTIQSSYCGKRWCTVCSAIKQAELIEAYLPSLEEMEAPYLVTLTIPAVKAGALKSTIRQMPKTFARIKDLGRKHNIVISGIRKIECNYNHDKQTFNPHYHILVDGEIEARYLKQQWLKRIDGSESIAQDIQVADKDTLKELFKYQSKVVVGKRFNAKATDTILQALNGIRTIQNFGKVKKGAVTFDSASGQVVTLSDTDKPVEDKPEARTVDIYSWDSRYNTWVNDDGEPLTDTLTNKHQEVVQFIRDG